MKKTSNIGGGVSNFGSPKPLPGQPGYRSSATAVLEKETQEMELKLRLLRAKMDNSVTTTTTAVAADDDGTRWKSSKEDKGSFRSYAKDVQVKHKTRTGKREDLLSASATSYMMDNSMSNVSRSQQSQVRIHSSKDTINWSISDVCEWLKFIGLEQHIQVFTQNEINGETLLDLALTDLDYMSITVLGQRKTILKGIEELKRNKKNTTVAGNGVNKMLSQSLNRISSFDDSMIKTSANSGSSSSSSSSGSSSINTSEAKQQNSHNHPTPSSSSSAKVHWSHLEPLASNKVDDNQMTSVNAADADIYDEEAERKAFQEAVMEWRRGSSETNLSSKESSSTAATTRGKDDKDDGMWHNPFGPNASSAPVTASYIPMSDDVLDEEKEQREFRMAVEAWRNSSNSSSSSSSNTITTSTTASSSSGTSQQSKISALAEQLSRQLDEEQHQAETRHAQQKDIAIHALRQTQEKKSEVNDEFNDSDDDDDDDINCYSDSESKHDPAPKGSIVAIASVTTSTFASVDTDCNYLVEECD